jgi:hypothetical protein
MRDRVSDDAELETNAVSLEPASADDRDTYPVTSDMAAEDYRISGGRLTTAQSLGAVWALHRLIKNMRLLELCTERREDGTSDREDGTLDPEAHDSSYHETSEPEVRDNRCRANGSHDPAWDPTVKRALMKTTLERTAQELLSSDTYDTLRNINKTVAGKRQLIEENSANQHAAKILWDVLERHQKHYTVSVFDGG